MHILICANGIADAPPERPQADRIIAADGGARLCQTLGIRPHNLIGDLDSLTPAEVAAWEKEGVHIHRYPTDKDQTDLELALQLAATYHPTRITILGALGGRWGQTLANLLLLAHPRWRALPIRLIDGNQQVFAISGHGAVHGAVGDTVSLIAVGGDAQGVTTQGLAYPLHNGNIPFGTALGVSNRLIAPHAEITVRQGVLLVVHISGPHH